MTLETLRFAIPALIIGFVSPCVSGTTPTVTTEDNVAIVEGFFQSFVDGTFQEYIYNNFAPDVDYRVVQDETTLFGAEREAVLTHTGLYEGPDGANYFFDQTGMERDVLSFDVHEIFGSGDSVAAFGSFRYRAPLARGGSGDLGETEWATRITMKNGKVFRYTFMEDSFAVAAFYRRKEPTKWRRDVAGDIRDISTGTNGRDVISPFDSRYENIIVGYGGDDVIVGGDFNDTLYGGVGKNTLTGRAGTDLFAIGEGAEGTPINRHAESSDFTLDIITDFVQGEDILGLTFGLAFEELEFTQDGDDLQISVRDTGQVLAILEGLKNAVLEKSDVKSFPRPTVITQVVEPSPDLPDGVFVRQDPFGERPDNPSLDEDYNIKLVELFLKNVLAGESSAIIKKSIHPDVRFTVAGTVTDLFGAERKAVLPYTGLYQGQEGVKSFFENFGADKRRLKFHVEEVYSSGNSVAAFGSSMYRALTQGGNTGEVVGSEWAARIWLMEENGRPLIYRFYLYEDTAAVAMGYRHKLEDSPKVEWKREFGGRDQSLLAATNASETLVGKDLPSEITGTPLRNRIFAYGGDDTVLGQTGNDFLYGGKGSDTLNGSDGHDDLYGGEGDDMLMGEGGDDNLYGNKGNDTLIGHEGADIFVLGKGEGTDIIVDFVDGEDRFGLLGSLVVDDLIISEQGNDIEIVFGQTGEILTIVMDTSMGAIDPGDFTKRSNSGAVINPRRDLLEFPEFGFGPDYPVKDHPLIDLDRTSKGAFTYHDGS